MRAEPHYVEQLTARAPAGHVRALPISEIECERPVDTALLDPLAASIAAHGVLQPLLVRPRSSRFELIAGARRLAAASRAGLSQAPCLVQACDDARARALEEATNVGAGQAALPSLAPQAPFEALSDIAQSMTAIQSCLSLLAERQAVLRDRVALDLIRTEAHTAGLVVRCLEVLLRDPAITPANEPLEPLLRGVIDGFEAERRLSGATITMDRNDHAHPAPVDHDCFATGIAGAIGGMLAIVRDSRTPTIHVRLSPRSVRGPLTIEVAQQSVTVSTATIARFFDVQWTERPGGYRAAVQLSAARRVLELHAGTIQVQTSDRGGSRILMTLPAPVASR
jgi:hypothetical protein